MDSALVVQQPRRQRRTDAAYTVTGTVDSRDFTAAMRLLGLDPDTPDRVLIAVDIAAGRVRAHYARHGEETGPDRYAEVYEVMAEHFPDMTARKIRDCSLAIVKRITEGAV